MFHPFRPRFLIGWPIRIDPILNAHVFVFFVFCSSGSLCPKNDVIPNFEPLEASLDFRFAPINIS